MPELSEAANWSKTQDHLFQTEHSDQHQGIVDAIAVGDEAGASRAMTKHLQAIRNAFQDEAS